MVDEFVRKNVSAKKSISDRKSRATGRVLRIAVGPPVQVILCYIIFNNATPYNNCLARDAYIFMTRSSSCAWDQRARVF